MMQLNETEANSERTTSHSRREGRELSSGESESFVDFALHPERYCGFPLSARRLATLPRGE